MEGQRMVLRLHPKPILEKRLTILLLDKLPFLPDSLLHPLVTHPLARTPSWQRNDKDRFCAAWLKTATLPMNKKKRLRRKNFISPNGLVILKLPILSFT